MARLQTIAIGMAVALCAAAMPALGQPAVPVVDPTENVKALNAAEAKRQDDLRTMEARYQNAMRDAETRRVNELATQKQSFDFELARILRANVEEKSTLLATQLTAVKADLDVRMTKQEQFRWESGGRSDQVAWIVTVVAVLAAVAGPIITMIAMRRHSTA